MFKLLSPLTVAGALLSLPCLGAAPAQALSKVTFVSGKGFDTGTCADPANPCRTFQFAIDQTIAFGEVKALDPAAYGAMVIAKSISITGIEGAGIDRNNAGDAITINAGPNDVVNLSHLTLNGLGIARNGIELNAGGSLTITHCAVRNFVQVGIHLNTGVGKTQFLIGHTLVSDNDIGIFVFPRGTGSAQGTLDHVLMNKNRTGMDVAGGGTSGAPIDVTSVDSMATNNNGKGFVTEIRAVLRLARSAATGNTTGVDAGSGGSVESFGDNDIRGNGTDVLPDPCSHPMKTRQVT